MVEETIQTVKETEAKADRIISDARDKQKEILEKAKKDAIQLREESLLKAKEKVKSDMEAVQQECEKKQLDEQQKIEAEVSILKEMALRKKEEAIDMIIGELI